MAKKTPITLLSKFYHKGVPVHEHTETLDYAASFDRDVDYELSIGGGKPCRWWCAVEKTTYDPKKAQLTIELSAKHPI